MASKLILLVAATAVIHIVKADENGCICDDVQIEKERDAVFKFIMKIKSLGFDEELPVIPGVLGPLVPCGNCIEYSRKKRTVLPQMEPRRDMRVLRNLISDSLPQRYDRRCPSGYYRVAGNCISSEYFDY